MEGTYKAITMLISEDEYNFIVELAKKTRLSISELVLLSVLSIDLPKHQCIRTIEQ